MDSSFCLRGGHEEGGQDMERLGGECNGGYDV